MPTTEPLPDPWLQLITENRKKLDELRIEHEHAAWRLDSAIHAAIDHGCQVTQVADAAGVSRPTAYRAWERHEDWLHPRLGA